MSQSHKPLDWKPFAPDLWSRPLLDTMCGFAFQFAVACKLEEVDPGPPPSDMAEELVEVVRAAKELRDRGPESADWKRICEEAGKPFSINLLGAYGVENAAFAERDETAALLSDRLSYFGFQAAQISDELVGSLSRLQFLFTQALLQCQPVLTHFKQKYSQPRPYELDPELLHHANKVIGPECGERLRTDRRLSGNPGHPSYPSGHTCQFYLAALLLDEIVHPIVKELGVPAALADGSTPDTLRAQLYAEGAQVGVNRERAGVHFRSDTLAGRRLAEAILPHFRTAYARPIQEAREQFRAYWMEKLGNDGQSPRDSRDQPH